MFKSIFSKMFTINILIIIFIFVVMGAALFTILGNYVTKQKEQLLIGYASKINALSYLVAEHNNKYFELVLSSISENSNSDIIIVDISGDIVSSSNSISQLLSDKLPKELYVDIIMGKTIKKIGNFNGTYKYLVLIGMQCQESKPRIATKDN